MEEAAQEDHPDFSLRAGDQIELGNMILEVGIKPAGDEDRKFSLN
jgi:hypothetical protein